MIPGDDQGKVTFTAVGRLSQGAATATVNVEHSDVPVQVAPQPKYTLPPDLREPTPTPSIRPTAPAGGAPQGQMTAPPSGAGAPGQPTPAAGQAPKQTQAPTPEPGASPGSSSTAAHRSDGGLFGRIQQLWQGITSNL